MYLTNELLAYCTNQLLPNPREREQFRNAVPAGERTAINQMLGAVLLQEDEQDVEVNELADERTEALDSVMFGGGESSKGKVVAYNIKNASKESLLPILGLVATASGLHVDPKQIPSTIGTLLAWWRNLVVLRSPQDDDAIAVVRAIGVLRVRSKWERAPLAPSNDELQTQTGLTPDRLHAALEKLKLLGVIKAVEWGGQAEDYTHADNRWSVSL